MTLFRLVAACLVLAVCACGDGEPPPPNVTFDGARALEYVKLQMSAGPRVPGTEAHRLVADRIVTELRKNADTVTEQTWTHVTKKGESLPMRNIFAQFNPSATTRILYVTHYDSRPTAENSLAEADRTKPTPGANDGASGVGMLLVLAEALKAAPSTVGVDMLFTDGEDYGAFNGVDADTAQGSDVLIGARYYAENILPTPSYRPTFGVLWDMVGDRDLLFVRDSYSEAAARDVNDRVWKMGRALGYARVFSEARIDPFTDDHIPLIAKGFKIIDVIDLDYGPGNRFHHSTQDVVDNVSAESLTIVGRVALALIRAEEGKK